MQTGIIFCCKRTDLRLRADIGDDVTISFDEVDTAPCDARQIEIPAEDWPQFAAAVTALLEAQRAEVQG